jgi:hypothetical protein
MPIGARSRTNALTEKGREDPSDPITRLSWFHGEDGQIHNNLHRVGARSVYSGRFSQLTGKRGVRGPRTPTSRIESPRAK